MATSKKEPTEFFELTIFYLGTVSLPFETLTSLHGWHVLPAIISSIPSFYANFLLLYFYNANLSPPAFHSYQTSFFTLLSGSLLKKAKNHSSCECEFLCQTCLWSKTQVLPFSLCIWLSPSLALPLSFYSRSLIIIFASFWWYECNSWPWVIWVWRGGWGSNCDVFWCFVLYYVWGFLCVVADLKPTTNPTKLVHEIDGKWRLEAQGLSVDSGWQNPGLDEIESSHGLTLNPSSTDLWTPWSCSIEGV